MRGPLEDAESNADRLQSQIDRLNGQWWDMVDKVAEAEAMRAFLKAELKSVKAKLARSK